MFASFRPLALTALAAALILPAAPAIAQDDLSRQLIDQCVGCRLPKDLHGRDLHGLRFVGSDLRNVDFSHANLRGARFAGADLDGAKFDDADLRDARFEGVSLHGTSFARAKLDGTRLSGVDFDGRSGVGMRRHALHGPSWAFSGEDGFAMPPMPDIQREVERAMRDMQRQLRHVPAPPALPSPGAIPAPPVPPVPPQREGA